MRWLALSLLAVTPAFADEDIADQYPGSPLYAKPIEVIPHVWSAIGATAPPTYENAGHNNNLSFIVTGDGVIVINGGAAYILAEALHAEIKAVTDQPVKLVIDENGQGHAMLGNSYWQDQGVPILAHIDAAADFEERGNRILEEQSLVIAGDMAFHERMLPIFEDTIASDWIETWDTGFEALNATYVIPGHGHPTNMVQVRRYTRDYLAHLREVVGTHLDNGGGLADAYYVDQSDYAQLDTYEELATKNAGRVYEQMEFE